MSNRREFIRFLGLGSAVTAIAGLKNSTSEPVKLKNNVGKEGVALLETPLELQLYGPSDPYSYHVDNRPLLKLLENDRSLRDAVVSLQKKVNELEGK